MSALRSYCLLWCLVVISSSKIRKKVDCSFRTGPFSGMLQSLRHDYSKVKTVLHDHDTVHTTSLLTGDLLDEMLGPRGCQTTVQLMEKYLSEWLPKADRLYLYDNQTIRTLDRLGGTLNGLMKDMVQCPMLICGAPSSAMMGLQSRENKLPGNAGVYKGLAEIDLLGNYLELYMSKFRR
ncbi:interleukin-10 [Saimiriine betaherpesvirus 4]|uniref:Viral interleukin-10 homolog n=1 Tax=Saimiriine betaherpesvirus 4 TaxID=1535247 RepID=G8XT09_9BETA|nr:interleukin-10 [Saimiriine betaherpesvirus 4]AEV80955.1 interleukin-10 [Saimiriine betaherpesvirus 4]